MAPECWRVSAPSAPQGRYGSLYWLGWRLTLAKWKEPMLRLPAPHQELTGIFELGQVFQRLLRRPWQLDLAAVVLENEALKRDCYHTPANVEKPADLRRIITEGLSQAPF